MTKGNTSNNLTRLVAGTPDETPKLCRVGVIRRKHELDALVAEQLGVSVKVVRDITTAFLSNVVDSLSDFEDVHLDSFGRFRMVVEKPQKGLTKLRKGLLKKNARGRQMFVKIRRKFRVHFAKSDVFKRILREKYGPNAKEKKP